MPSLSSLLILAAIFAFAASSEAQTWAPKQAPLMTKWAKDVSPSNVHLEYPRPQMVRKDWMNLNGLWDYAVSARGKEPGPWDGKILVPFPIESALSGVMRRVDENQTLTYHRSVQIPAKFHHKTARLHFGAVDYHCEVFVDGSKIGEHTGGYDPFYFDLPPIDPSLKEIELIVKVTDATGDFQPRGKQWRKPEGIWYTSCTGIWQAVWMEPLPLSSIESLKIEPKFDAKLVSIQPIVRAQDTDLKVVVSAYDKGTLIGKADGKPNAVLEISIPDMKPWSPDSPFLYDLKVDLLEAGKRIDSVTSYFGMRKIALSHDADGRPSVQLNNKDIFSLGPLDQGFWPDGIYTPPTEAAMKYDLDVTKQLGFNTIRKHVKVESARWYYLCDKMGFMVWQDMPSAHFTDTLNDKTMSLGQRTQFRAELTNMIGALRNAPSIVMWIPFNEGWGQHDTQDTVKYIHSLDPSRLINNATGWTDMKVGDTIDIHAYPGPAMPAIEKQRVAVLGEFGGLGLGVDGHTWTAKAWGYQGMADKEALTSKYVELLRRTHELKARGLTSAIYTQTTDVETECNGFLTYDRSILKMDLKRVRDANLGKFPPPKPMKYVLPNAIVGPTNWRYSIQKPTSNWTQKVFDDSSWLIGLGGFGTEQTPGSIVKTAWNSNDIWIRREFEFPNEKVKNLRLYLHHDEDVEVYINGVLALKADGWTTGYEGFPISRDALATIKNGTNVIAAHCRQTSGGQYLDIGIIGDK